jgi:hypothetical protein
MVASLLPRSELLETLLPAAPVPTIKLLDLLTNRYHLGLLCGCCTESMEVELPLSSHLHVGQRVRFVVASDRGLVAREEMRGAVVMHVARTLLGKEQRISLTLLSHPADA